MLKNKCSWHICQCFSEPWCYMSSSCSYRQRKSFLFFLFLPSFPFFLFFLFSPLLNNDCVRLRLHLLMGYVVDNVVYIFGVTPPLKLLQAYQITLTNSHATINISPNLSQLATFSVCLKRWLTGLSIIRIARHKQIRLLRMECIVRCAKRMYHIGHVLNSLNVLLIMTLPCAFSFPWKWFSSFLSSRLLSEWIDMHIYVDIRNN